MIKVYHARGAYDCTGIVCENDVRLVFYSYGVVMNTINIKDFQETNKRADGFSNYVAGLLKQFEEGQDISLI